MSKRNLQSIGWWGLVSCFMLLAAPALAQYPSSLEEQQRFFPPQRGEDPRPATDPRSAKAPAAEKLEADTDARPLSPYDNAPKPPSKDPRSAAPSDAYPAFQKSRKAAPVCDISQPPICAGAMSEQSQTCESAAWQCQQRVDSQEDMSCVAIRCEIKKTVCLRQAMETYIACLNGVLGSAGAVVETSAQQPQPAASDSEVTREP